MKVRQPHFLNTFGVVLQPQAVSQRYQGWAGAGEEALWCCWLDSFLRISDFTPSSGNALHPSLAQLAASVCVSSSSPGHDLQGQGTQRKEVKFQPLPSVLLTGTDMRLALQWHV